MVTNNSQYTTLLSSQELNSQIDDLSHICTKAKLELGRKNDPEKLNHLTEVLKNNIITSKKLINKIKRQSENDLQLKESLIKIKTIKNESKEVVQNINEKKELLENRKKLYGSHLLGENLSFSTKIKELQKSHPELKENFHHLQHVVRLHMRTSKGMITREDINKLNEFLTIARSLPIPELVKLIEDEIQVIRKAYDGKMNLLTELKNSLDCFEVPFQEWTVEKKLMFYANTQQYLFNPFEPPIEPSDLFASIQTEDKDLQSLFDIILQENKPQDVRKEFWDYVPVLEKKAQALANSEQKKQKLIDYKSAGLKLIISKKEISNDNEVLIIGGGPGGLMRALGLSVMGRRFTVIEQRASEGQNRKNVITLAKNDAKDAELLLFFGILNVWDRDQNASFSHLKPHLLEVKIGDVETALKNTLGEIGCLNKVLFKHKVKEINNEGGKAKVTISDLSDPKNELTIEPSLVIVTDGASSPTRKVLGLSKKTLAKTTQIAYSIFKNPSHPISGIKYRIINFLKGVALAIASLINALIFFRGFEEALGNVIQGGPTAIFRIPEHDYLIRCLRTTEQGQINIYQNKINELKKKIQRYEEKNRNSVESEEINIRNVKIKRLQEELAVLVKQKENHLTTRAQKMHGVLDILSSIYSRHHRVKQMEVSENYLVDIVVGKAERSFVKIGKTPVILRGDASHTTDPYSGYGCKTAFEETLADQYLFSSENTDQLNDLQYACQNIGHEFYTYSMINHGLHERASYRRCTELLERYTDLAVKQRILTEDEAADFEYLFNKAKNGFPLTPNEVMFLGGVERRLLDNISKRQINVKSKNSHWQNSLTMHEKWQLRRFIRGARNKNLVNNIERIIATMAYEDAKEAPVLGLLLALERMKMRNTGEGLESVA